MKSGETDNKASLDEFYERNKRIFFKYAQIYNVGRPTLEDIYQESILAMWQNIKKNKYKGTSSLSSYLMGICKFTLYNYFRDEKNIFEELSPTVTETADHYVDEEDKKKILKIIPGMLEKANDNCRRIFELSFYENMKQKEIAKILNYSDNTVVKTRKSECLKKFADALRKQLKLIGIKWKTKYEK